MESFTVTDPQQLCSGGREPIKVGETAYSDSEGWVFCGMHTPVDHMTCPASAHDFDPDGTRPDEQNRDENGRRLCNDCHELCFYCTRDNNYHHAGKDVRSCFLVPEQSFDIPVPAAIPVPADWPGNEVNRTLNADVVARVRTAISGAAAAEIVEALRILEPDRWDEVRNGIHRWDLNEYEGPQPGATQNI